MPRLTDFPHAAGAHCSSTSIRNVLRYDGAVLSEALVFGLGSGLGFFYIHDADASPTHRFNGRTANLEGKFYRQIGQPLRWAATWSPTDMAQALANDRPILAQTDIYDLPYYQPSVHFIGHGIVLTAIDLATGTVTVADIADDAPLTISLEALRNAMRYNVPPLLRPFHWAAAPRLREPLVTPANLRNAILDVCDYMLAPPSSIEGLPAMAAMAASMPGWAAAPDCLWCARFGYQAIEKRGTGGGGFRHLYADFLQEAQLQLPQIGEPVAVARFQRLGEQWSALADTLKAVFTEADPTGFDAAGGLLEEIVAGETAVLQDLQQALERP